MDYQPMGEQLGELVRKNRLFYFNIPRFPFPTSYLKYELEVASHLCGHEDGERESGNVEIDFMVSS